MITFITDVLERETDILDQVKNEYLLVLGLDGSLLESIPAPDKGWTHVALEEQAQLLRPKTRLGAEAFVGKQWVGSTEV